MIKISFKALCISLLINLSVYATADPLDAFPAAEANMHRVVIQLAEKSREQEADFKVELISGKMMLSDGVNQMRLGSSISAHGLKGWGYTFYTVEQNSAAFSTMMAVPEGTIKVQKFISGAPIMIPYNSRLPIVVYLPTEYELRYRLWEAPTKFITASPE